nr:unnamed protein product [Spirometra erinaceieuropaei]
MGAQHPSSGSMVCADDSVEVTKDNQHMGFRHPSREDVLVFLEFTIRFVRDDRDRGGGGVGADGGGESGSLKRHVRAHQVITDALWQTGKLSHDAVRGGKGDARVPSPCPGATAPEEEKGVAGAYLF